MKTAIIVQNLKCGGCAKTIISKVSEIQNISDVEVDVMQSKVSFHSNSEADSLKVKETLKSLGYPSIDEENGLTAKAKSMVSCMTGKIS
ncbi:heavy-metal-associated domain-containing protein [Mangrovimonas sp. ST2L15]|uniref:heavy-metal-associated domain-containing protein n=1 Tax=Mangrovimonas sp. ST2L15 TaxID=1645916 RepID=UPI0006B4577B|nr:heavy metal-associated domain-containing protein [Mangrovimonas sp. ST2L15]